MDFEHTEECEVRERPNECVQCSHAQPRGLDAEVRAEMLRRGYDPECDDCVEAYAEDPTE